MGASSNNSGKFGDTGVIELTGKIMVVAIVLLFFVVVFVFCLHLYAKYFWYRRQEAATTRRRRRRFDFAAGHQEITVVAALRRGLDPSVLKTIPVVIYDPKEFKDGLECAVCLCEVSEGEKTRLLPHCNHGFHVECIDMWFQSHPTCPLCRNPVSNTNQENNGVESPLESILQAPQMGDNSNFPTNVLVWGDENEITTLVPSLDESHQNHQGNAVSEPSSSSMASTSIDIMNEDEEQKSQLPTRLRSLKRLLSGSSRRVTPSSPRNLDLEQGRGQT